MTKHLLSTLLVLLLLLLPPTHVVGAHDLLEASTFALQTRDVNTNEIFTICTASSIDTLRHLWLTAAHCVKGGERWIGGQVAVTVLTSQQMDLAILMVPLLRMTDQLALASTSPTVGNTVRMTGFPLGANKPVSFWGRVASIGLDTSFGIRTIFDMSVCAGHSGSPIVNKDNEIISVAQFSIESYPCSASVGGAQWEDVVRFVQSIE